MRAVVQRVSKARVTVAGQETGAIGCGLLVLLGIGAEDNKDSAFYLAEKIVNLRIFEDNNGKMNFSLADVTGEMLVVSQFTLYGDTRKGRRPSFAAAAAPGKADSIYNMFCDSVRNKGIKVETGRFQSMMDVELINSGPVTILLDSDKQF